MAPKKNSEGDGILAKVTLHATDEPAPILTLHCVKQDSLEASLNVLVNGFNYGDCSQPFGIYTVDANSPRQSGMIASYDGGAAIVLKPTGFVVNISNLSSGRKKRYNKNHWVTGAPPGVILFRRMPSKLREFILHRASVQFAYISMEQTLFEPWAREYAVAHPDNIRAAHEMRRDWKARAGVVLPGDDELTINCNIAQTMACIDPVSRAPLMVAQPRRSRSRSRSRSVERPMGGVGAEIPPHAAFLDRFAAKKPDRDLHKRWEQSDHVREFAGSASSIAEEPDRR